MIGRDDARRASIIAMFAWAADRLGYLFWVDDGLMPFEAVLAFSPIFTCIGVVVGLRLSAR